MLPKKNRVETLLFNTLPKEVGLKKKHTRFFFVSFIEKSADTSPSPLFKVACIVSKKIFKKAHDRNRLRRVFYRYVHSLYKDPLYSDTGVYICTCKKECSLYGDSPEDFKKDVLTIFEKK